MRLESGVNVRAAQAILTVLGSDRKDDLFLLYFFFFGVGGGGTRSGGLLPPVKKKSKQKIRADVLRPFMSHISSYPIEHIVKVVPEPFSCWRARCYRQHLSRGQLFVKVMLISPFSPHLFSNLLRSQVATDG